MELWNSFLQHPALFLAIVALVIWLRKPIFLFLVFLAELPPVALILTVGSIMVLIVAGQLFLTDAALRREVLVVVVPLGAWSAFIFFKVFNDLPKDFFTDGGKRTRHLKWITGALAIVASLWALNASGPWSQSPQPASSIQDVDFTFMCGRWADREVDDSNGELIPEFQRQPKVLIWKEGDDKDRFEVYRVPAGVLTHEVTDHRTTGWYFTAWKSLGLSTKALRDALALGPDGRRIQQVPRSWWSKLGLE